MSKRVKKEWKEDKKGIIGCTIIFVLFVIACMTFPMTLDSTINVYKDQLASAKTCSDVLSLDTPNIVTGSFIETFDTENQVKNMIDQKAHELCKPLYAMQKKYGDITLADLSKVECSDLGVLVKNTPVKQEVINEYVKRCEVK